MKKHLYFLLFLFIFILFSPKDACKVAYAEGETDVTGEIIDGLETDTYQQFLEEITSEYGIDFSKTIRALLEEIVRGDNTMDAEYFGRMVFRLFVGNIGGYLAQMTVIVLVCVLMSMLRNLGSGFMSKSIEKIVYLACYGVIISVILAITGSVVTDTVKLVSLLTTFSQVIFPPLFTLMTALGSLSVGGIYQPALSFLTTTLVTIIDVIVLPVFYLCLILTIVGHLSEEIKLKKAIKTAKSFAEWALSFFFGIFITITTAKGIAGVGFDSFSVRNTKAALSGYIPIVGNYINEGFDIVIASCIVVKNALGVTAIILLLLCILSPLIKIFLCMLSLRITASMTEIFGESSISEMLFDVSDCLKLVLVIVICIGFSFYVLIMLILTSFNRGLL